MRQKNNQLTQNETLYNDKDVRLWYVIKTKPSAETQVELRLKMAGFDVFYPQIRTFVRGAKRPISRVKSLFPSYIFIKLDISNADMHRMIKYTRNVSRILGCGDVPVSIPDEAIDIIKERLGPDGIVEQQLMFKRGDKIFIKNGMFKDLVGILERPVSDEGRVRVLMDIMNKRVYVNIPCSDIELAA